jgi:hypothetical protein
LALLIAHGFNIEYAFRSADNNAGLSKLAAELVALKVDVLVALYTPCALAAQQATREIPIVTVSGDPVGQGLVASLARPGGNLTGVTTLNYELEGKRLDLLHQMVPMATVIGVLINPTNSIIADTLSRELPPTARALGLKLHVLHASNERDFDTVFATLIQLRADGLLISSDYLFTSHSEQLAALTVRHALPTIYQYREFAAAGGLMSYGGSPTCQPPRWPGAVISRARLKRVVSSMRSWTQMGESHGNPKVRLEVLLSRRKETQKENSGHKGKDAKWRQHGVSFWVPVPRLLVCSPWAACPEPLPKMHRRQPAQLRIGIAANSRTCFRRAVTTAS